MGKEDNEEEFEPEFALMDECEIYIVFDKDEKAYQAYLQIYNHAASLCFVMPLKRIGTDPVKLGQIVHSEMRLLVHSLDNQFMEVDEHQEIIIHESETNLTEEINSVKSLEELKHKLENNKIFMVIGHETLQ